MASSLFGFFFVFVVMFGVGSVVWRVSTARRMAQRAGMDTGDATMMALMTEDGLDSTYLASNLRDRRDPGTPVRPTSAERLTELQGLKDRGLITDAEYAARRQAIIDDI
jgi:hypothetical protein